MPTDLRVALSPRWRERPADPQPEDRSVTTYPVSSRSTTSFWTSPSIAREALDGASRSLRRNAEENTWASRPPAAIPATSARWFEVIPSHTTVNG